MNSYNELESQDQEESYIYSRLYGIGKSFNEKYETVVDFTTRKLKFEKCLVFEYDEANSLFKIVKSAGYKNPDEQDILTNIHLTFLCEEIEYLGTCAEPVVHTRENPQVEVAKLAKSLSLSEAYFELFGGDKQIPFGLIIVGNGFGDIEKFSKVGSNVVMTALKNFTLQFSSTLNSVIFYKAWQNEKRKLKESILKRYQKEQQHNTFESPYKNIKKGIALVDLKTMSFLDVNQVFANMMGYNKNDILALNFLDFSVKGEMRKNKEAIDKIVDFGYLENLKINCVTKNTSVVTLLISMILIGDKESVLLTVKEVYQQDKDSKKSIEQSPTSNSFKLEKKYFNMFEVIESAISFIEFKAHEKNLELIVKYDTKMGDIFYGDGPKIEQVIKNLLENAVKFTDSGEVGVYVTKIDDEKFRFEVTYSGIGLNQLEQVKILQPFSKEKVTKENDTTELELLSSKQLIELMDGKIWVESELHTSSKFIFDLELEEKGIYKEYNLFPDKKVLVVDDNETWHEILENTLHVFNLKVEHANSANEAIAKIHECKNRYDLILLDWNMPEVDGIQASKSIRRICLKCTKKDSCSSLIPPPVILISSYRQEAIYELANDAGMNLFLQKPINPSVLNEILSDIFLEDSNTIYNQSKELHRFQENISSLAGTCILLTEDNSTNQELIVSILENNGIHIDLAYNGKQVVEMFESQPSKYELILMDTEMLVLDGFEATKTIRAKNKNIPIVALTQNVVDEDIQKIKTAGMNGYLKKPIDIKGLYEILLENRKKNIKKQKTLLEKDTEGNFLNFSTIDTKVGITHMMDNMQLYMKILKDFYIQHKDLQLESLSESDLKRTTHTIKGLAATIGAKNLHKISEELDLSQDKTLYPAFYQELNAVLSELKQLPLEVKTQTEKIDITEQKRDELFDELKNFIIKKRTNKCLPLIEEIQKYQLNKTDNLKLQELKVLVQNRKFKEALESIGK